jgi:glycosyltransferase involved in cell wall biosynthesis
MLKDARKLMDLITVYVPTRNRAQLLRRAIESVTHQTYTSWELIIVDDNSGDETVDYLRELAASNSKITIILNKCRKGACASRNLAIQRATGKFITGLDDDDYFLPTHLDELRRAWYAKSPGVIAVYPLRMRIKNQALSSPKLKPPKTCEARNLLFVNYIGSQIFTETRLIRSINGFDERMPAWQDTECWFRLLNQLEGKAERARKPTYVVDATHGHVRISSGGLDAIRLAYERFVEKHHLMRPYDAILRLKLTFYGARRPDFSAITKKILFERTLINLKSSLIIMYLWLRAG